MCMLDQDVESLVRWPVEGAGVLSQTVVPRRLPEGFYETDIPSGPVRLHCSSPSASPSARQPPPTLFTAISRKEL